MEVRKPGGLAGIGPFIVAALLGLGTGSVSALIYSYRVEVYLHKILQSDSEQQPLSTDVKMAFAGWALLCFLLLVLAYLLFGYGFYALFKPVFPNHVKVNNPV